MILVVDSTMLAMVSQNSSIYIYSLSKDANSHRKYTVLPAPMPLSQLDWSEDGQFLQTTGNNLNLMYCKFSKPLGIG